MRILLTPDTGGWAIDNLCRSISLNARRLEFVTIPVHPRGVGEAIGPIHEALKQGIDLWHAQYRHSAVQLMALIPELRSIPKVLTHHNHYALEKESWADFDCVTEWTKWGCDVLKKNHPNVAHIPMGIDLERYSYVPKLEDDGKTIGYVGRVVPWKNLGEITRVSKELGFHVVGAGFIDKTDYWNSIDKSNLEYLGSQGWGGMTPANMKDDLYKRMTVFVQYATDEKESGTLPFLEAMARGVPVLTTWQGTARDIIEDGKNAIVFDKDNFKEKLAMVMGDPALRERLRHAAWETIKNMPEEKMARDFMKLYYKTLFKKLPVVSVVITSYNRPEGLLDAIASVDAQDYPAKEIIVADDGSTDPLVFEVVEKCRRSMKTPILLIKNQNKNGYDLGKMRNLAAIEAIGETILIFQDRFTLDDGMLEKIATHSFPKQWGYGAKRVDGVIGDKSAFLEGFAWIQKIDLMNAGGFSERVDRYGGQSQELRLRFGRQGFAFNRYTDIIATQTIGSGRDNKRPDIWKSKLTLWKMGDYLKAKKDEPAH